ncbi:MAG: hypothetical protein H6R10_2372 [Rhodocyclaceae bacterium]|nr:hypothetical protein [Rhodocyclaceae bacterium]
MLRQGEESMKVSSDPSALAGGDDSTGMPHPRAHYTLEYPRRDTTRLAFRLPCTGRRLAPNMGHFVHARLAAVGQNVPP